MTCQKGLYATVTFILEVRGVIVVTSTLKTKKSSFGEYCTSNSSTPYDQPVTHVFGTEEKAFFEGALVADNYLEFCTIHGIPIFFTVQPLPFNPRM